ncbi:MAG: hypothetical protein ACEQR8_00500, partial [Cypionkella sp.]
CRNGLLYCARATRARAFDRLGEAVAGDGWLMIGAGESAAGHATAFAPACDTSGLYRRKAPPGTGPLAASAALKSSLGKRS